MSRRRNWFLVGVTAVALTSGAIARAETQLRTDLPTKTYDLSSTQVIDKVVLAPRSVFFVGINPLRYPEWQLTVNDTIVNGPTLAFEAQVSQGVGTGYGPKADASTGNNTTVTATDMSSPLPDFAKFDENTQQVDKPQTCASSNGAKPLSANDLSRCARDLDSRGTTLRTEVNQQVLLLNGVVGYLRAAASAADAVLNNPLDALSGRSSIASAEDYSTYKDVVNRRVLIHIRSAKRDLASLRDYPKDVVDALIAELKHAEQVRALLAASNAAAPGHGGSTAQATSDAKLLQQLQGSIQSEITALNGYASSSARATWYSTTYPAVKDAFTKFHLDGLSAARFGAMVNEACDGLGTSGRERLVTLTLGSRVTSVKVVCQSRMFVSAGIGFTGSRQPSFAPVPAKPLPTAVPDPSLPAPLATPAIATIQATTSFDAEPTIVVLDNFSLSNRSQESAFYASFGVSLEATSATDPQFAYIAGLSWSMSRTYVLTAGAQYGRSVELASGYGINSAIGPSTNSIQTINRYSTKFFLGVTFGKASQ